MPLGWCLVPLMCARGSPRLPDCPASPRAGVGALPRRGSRRRRVRGLPTEDVPGDRPGDRQPPDREQLSQAFAGAQLTAILVNTYGQVVHSRGVAEEVAKQFPELTASTVEGKLFGSVEAGTFIIDVSARDSSAERSQALANAAADALSGVVRDLQVRGSDRISIAVLERADAPTVPISPRRPVDLGLGIALGLVAGLALVSLLEALDRTVKSPAQAQLAADAPLLAVVSRKSNRFGMDVSDRPGSSFNEAHRTLRTALRFPDESAPRTIVVTGAGPRDGATSTAVNLAQAFALSGESVLLVDADLRSSQLAKSLSIKTTTGGLAAALLQGGPLEAHVQPWRAQLDLLLAGTTAADQSELVGSQAMVDLIHEAGAQYDVVIVDTPPVLQRTDAAVLAAHVDGAVLVVRHRTTTQQSIAEAARRLHTVGAEVLGVVLTSAPPQSR